MSSSVSDLIRAVVLNPSSRHSSRSGRGGTNLGAGSTWRTDCSSGDRSLEGPVTRRNGAPLVMTSSRGPVSIYGVQYRHERARIGFCRVFHIESTTGTGVGTARQFQEPSQIHQQI